MKMNIFVWLLRLIMGVMAAFLLFAFSWALIFSCPYLALLALVVSGIALPIGLKNKRIWFLRAALLSLFAVAAILTVQVPVKEIDRRIAELAARPRDPDSLSGFSLRDKAGIYGLNIAMAALAYPLYPEVSRETFLLIFPAPKNGVRTFKSSFPLKSSKIHGEIRRFNLSLKNTNCDELRAVRHVSWSAGEYALGQPEARFALALNPAELTMTADRRETEWLIKADIRVKVAYPQNAYVFLLARPKLRVEEGLFWVLQQTGWLHPYTAHWSFSVSSADERIR